jgi:hypothetical protein
VPRSAPPHRTVRRKTYINFWSTTYKSSYFPNQPTTGMPRNPRLPAASGFNSNFATFRATTSSHGGRLPQPPATPQRRVNTAPAGDAAFRRAKIDQLKELTGYQSNFGPNVACFLPDTYVSAHNSKFAVRAHGHERAHDPVARSTRCCAPLDLRIALCVFVGRPTMKTTSGLPPLLCTAWTRFCTLSAQFSPVRGYINPRATSAMESCRNSMIPTQTQSHFRPRLPPT